MDLYQECHHLHFFEYTWEDAELLLQDAAISSAFTSLHELWGKQYGTI